LELGEQTGVVKWKCIDLFTRFRDCAPAFNCMHAVADVSGVPLRTGIYCGRMASRSVVRHFCRLGLIIDPETTHDWAYEAVVPKKCEIIREPKP
jgi:hypothetical protein